MLGAHTIVNLDADNQYCADDIATITSPIVAGAAGVVIGERPLCSMERFSPLKLRLHLAGNAFLRWLTGTAVTDATSGIRGPDRPADFETYYHGVRDTGLANLFAQSSYRNSSTSWPRVMIVIEEKPKFNGGMPSEYFHSSTKTETDYTWRFHATVWTDATHSIDIAPFNWAFSEMRYNTPYSEVPIWGRTPKQNVSPPAGLRAAAASPSTQPAALPIAPKSPLPEQPDYHRLFHYNTIMVSNVLLDMGFNYNRPDGRVWFVEDLTK
jgi:hypothetical protein